MDYVLIAFFTQLAVFYFLILGFEFHKRSKAVVTGVGKTPAPVLKDAYWRKAS